MQFETTPPWQKREPPIIARYLTQVLCYGLFILAFTSALIVFALLFALTQGLTPANRVQNDVLYILLFTVSTLLFGGIAIFLQPKTRIPSRFQPSYGYVAPETLDEPFEVRFYRYFLNRSLVGKGAIRFAPEGLQIAGKLEPPMLLQALIFLLVVVTWKISLITQIIAFLLVIVLFVWLSKKHRSLIPYAQLEVIELDGRIVVLRSTQKPSQIAFVVAASDGERLYNELKHYFPSKLLQAKA